VIRIGLVFVMSLGLGVVGLYLAGGAVFEPATYAPSRGDPWALAAVALSVVGLWSLQAWRLKLLVRYQGTNLGFASALMVHLSYTLGCALTPGGSGGGPVLATALHRLGVRWGRGIGVAVQVFILDIVFLAWASPVALLYLLWVRGLPVPFAAQVLVWTCVGLAGGTAILLAGFPGAAARLILWLARLRPLRRWRRRSRGLAHDYYRAGRIFRSLSPVKMAALQITHHGGWACSFLALWGWMNLYLATDLPLVAAGLTTASLLSIAMPTPGASGLIEAVVGLGAMAEVDDRTVAAPILLWRITTFYLIYVAGPWAGWWLLRQARRGGSR
jgi:uncharacterized protein (TIRG00374 family)